MKKNFRTIAAFAWCGFIAAALGGCSKVTVLRVHEIQAIQTKIDSLYALQAAQTARQQQLIDEQHKRLAEQNRLMMAEVQTSVEALRQIRAEQRVRFNELDGKVTTIENNVSESQSKLVRLDRQTTEVGRRIEQQIAAQEATAQRQLQLEGLFDIAMGDFNAGRYDLAMSGFRDIIKQFADSPQAVEAEYWIAESHYAKGEFASAEKAYFDFVRDRSDSNRYCVSLYKLGLAYERQEKNRSRDLVWRNLLERCANAPEAHVVRATQQLQQQQQELQQQQQQE